MIFNSRKNLSFAFLLFFAVLVSFGSVCAADTNNAYGNYTFGHLDKPTVPHHDIGDLPIMGGDSVAVNDINTDDSSSLNNCGHVLLDSGDDSASNDNITCRNFSLGLLSPPDPGDLPIWEPIIIIPNIPELTNDGDLVYNSSPVDRSGVILDDNNDFTMSARYNTGTGFYWKVSSDSYGVDLISIKNVIDHFDACGSSATSYFKFHVTSEDYYVKLILVGPTGNIVDEIDSNMIN